MTSVFLPKDAKAIPVALVSTGALEAWLAANEGPNAKLARAAGFRAKAGEAVLVPDADGAIARVVAGVGGGEDAFCVASLPTKLPGGDYRFEALPDGLDGGVAALAWADGAYRFGKYRKEEDAPRRLVWPEGVNAEDVGRQAVAIDWLRDLVNTPTCDLGPAGIEDAARALAKEFGAKIEVTTGENLASGFPMVHAVGMAAEEAPRFIELTWGDENAPVLALVGKGVAFDTGGLNIKTGDYMTIMKKDMGGAAHVLALARLVMGAKLKVRLVMCVPAVENAIGSKSFRPGDVLKSRKGLTVEIGNTDAEGRLILGDALTRASELKPDLLIDFATLTGAARVALGSDLAPVYTDDEALAAGVLEAGAAVSDPVWRMPLYAPYASGLSSPIADTRNISDGPMGGSITAALFLKKFVDAKSWAHFDVWAWRPARYGRPAGAAANGLRAVWGMLKAKYGQP